MATLLSIELVNSPVLMHHSKLLLCIRVNRNHLSLGVISQCDTLLFTTVISHDNRNRQRVALLLWLTAGGNSRVCILCCPSGATLHPKGDCLYVTLHAS